jgi:hypothetical protein
MRFLFIVLGLLVGCSGTPNVGSETGSAGGTPAQPDLGNYEGDQTSGGGGPCSNAFQRVDVDGGFITIPIPCNPFWRDTGDPPPDRLRKTLVDPNPEGVIIVGPQRGQQER